MKNDKFSQIVLVCAFILAFCCVVIGLIFDSTPKQTDIEQLNQLQQERFKYEREQQDIQDYLRTQETINKINSGYYQ